MKNSKLVIALVCFGLSVGAALAQKPLTAAEPELLGSNQRFVVTFHQPILGKDGKVSQVPGTQTALVGEALSETEINNGFKTGDRVVVRIKAPVDSVVYVVNNSQWDGLILTNKGVPLKMGIAHDFIYKLTNRQGKNTAGFEQLIFLVRRTAFTDSELNGYLIERKGSLPQVKLPSQTVDTKATVEEFKKESKGKVIARVSCKIASIFFPWVGGFCKVTRFAAAQPESLAGDATGLSPTTDAENMVVQFSFPVQP